MNREIWKDIKGYEGIYQISNYGNVRNIKKNKNLQLEETFKGYLRTTLCKNGKKKHFKVHRLVAQTFLDNSNNLP